MAPSSRMAEYRRQVQARYAPVVATVTTPEADAACARCGVRSFADLLRPFADVRGLNVPMRHNAEAPPYALSEISIRFHGVRECRRVAPEVAEAYARRAFEPWDATDDEKMRAMLDAVPQTTRDAIRFARESVDGVDGDSSRDRGFFSIDGDVSRAEETKRTTSEGENEETLVSWFGAPWFDRFARRARRASCAFSDFETTDHPRAVVFATAIDASSTGHTAGCSFGASRSSEHASEDEKAAETNENENDSRLTSYLVETFEKMSAPYYENPESYPPAIRSEAADPDVARHFVALHAPTITISEACLRAVRDALSSGSGGSEVHVTALPILASEGKEKEKEKGGSSEDGASATRARELAHLFVRDAEARLVASESSPADGSPTAIADCIALRDEDVETLRAFVRAFATETLLPHMERRLTALNANIASTRKGLKNQLKTFWGRNVAAAGALGGFGGSFGALANVTGNVTGTASVSGSASSSAHARKPSDEGGSLSSNEDTKYSFRSPECEIRLAADLAFSLRDHETAAHHYRLLQSDFKADKAFRRLACAHESLAEALICGPALGSASENYAENGRVVARFVVNDSAKREIDAAFESAVAAHRKSKSAFGVSETSNWTWRASHSRAVFLAAVGAHRDAAIALATVSGDEGLPHQCAATALEAAAVAFLRTDPPSTRKFAMHATLAGHRFAQAGFRAHAARCYASALPAYEAADDVETKSRSFFPDGSSVKTPWARAREHLHFALGRQIARCGGSPAAASHFEKLLFCADGVSAAAQATYLREFLFVDARREAKHASTLDDSKIKIGVCVPEIDVGDVVVGFEDGLFGAETRETKHSTGDKDEKDGVGGFVSERRWRAMESDGVVPAHLATGGPGGSTWLDAHKNAGGKKKIKGGEQFGVCAAGETVFFETRFRNPLRIPVSMTEVSLRCDFETERNEARANEHEHVNENVNANEAFTLAERERARVSTTPQDITLLPLETRLVRLACVPETEGTLFVRGVSWRLRLDETSSGKDDGDGVATSPTSPTTQVSLNYVPFETRAPRTRRGADGVSWVRDTPRERRLALRVTPAMPKLECRLLDIPESLPLGGVAKVTLVARNVARPRLGIPTRSGSDSSTTDLCDKNENATAALRVRVRLPGDGLVVLAETFSEPTAETFSGSKTTRVEKDSRPRGSASVVQPPSWSVVRPGETVSLAFYLRATRAGVVDAPFVVCYEPPEPAPPSLRYRVARVSARIRVTPSLKIHARVSDAATHPAARVVRVAARNVSVSRETFHVRAVRLLASESVWERLRSDETRNETFLRPAVRVGLPQSAEESSSETEKKTQTRGLAIEPGKARDAVFLAGPSEALATDADAENENVSDVVSYVGLNTHTDASELVEPEVEAAHVAALERLVRASFAASTERRSRDASRREASGKKKAGRSPNPPTAEKDAPRGGDEIVVVEWETMSRESGARLFIGAHAFSAPLSRVPALTDANDGSRDDHARDLVRFTLEGPPASTIETRNKADGVSAFVSARFFLRAHNPSRFPKRVTFESAQRGARVDSNVSSFPERGDEDDDGGHAGVPASGWTRRPPIAVETKKTRGRAEESDAEKAPRVTSLPPGRPWLWTGPTRRTATVPSGATATIEVVATAFAPGVFVLNEYRLIVRAVGDAETSGAYGDESSNYVARPEDASDAPFVWTVSSD